jgi:alpha-tubulin suppressor-like RCC1 family protein
MFGPTKSVRGGRDSKAVHSRGRHSSSSSSPDWPQHGFHQGNRQEVLGDVFACGSGDMGILGVSEIASAGPTPTWRVHGTPLCVESLRGKGVIQVAAGIRHSLALTGDGTVYGWGSSFWGAAGVNQEQCSIVYPEGDGDEIPVPIQLDIPAPCTFISAGDFHSAAVTRNGDLYTWGSARYAQLGQSMDTFVMRSTPTLASFFREEGIRIRMVACGTQHTVCLSDDGQVFIWGNNAEGYLGLDGDVEDRKVETQPIRMTSLSQRGVVFIACGNFHSIALTKEGELFSWGAGRHGQLGHNDLKDVPFPKMIRGLHTKRIGYASCGAFFSAALTEDGRIYTWGHKESGKLGLGPDCERIVRLPNLVRFLALKEITSISCGYHTMAAVSKTGELFTWGLGEEGQVGRASKKSSTKPLIVRTPSIHFLSASCSLSHTLLLSLPQASISPARTPSSIGRAN